MWMIVFSLGSLFFLCEAIFNTKDLFIQIMAGLSWACLFLAWYFGWRQTKKRYTSLIENVDYSKIPAKGGKEIYMRTRVVFEHGKLYEIYPPHKDSIEY